MLVLLCRVAVVLVLATGASVKVDEEIMDVSDDVVSLLVKAVVAATCETVLVKETIDAVFVG